MTSRAFAIRLAIVLLVFVVVVPGAVIGLIYKMEKTPGWRDASLGLGYAAFFLGIPIWILSLAIALWRATAARARTLGLPGWIAISFLVLVIAEWKFFLWMFYSFRVPFLAGAGVLLAALLIWPAPASDRGDAPAKTSPARLAAIAAIGVHALLASAALAGSLVFSLTLSTSAYQVETYATRFAGSWFFVLCAAMIWAVVDAHRRRVRTKSLSRKFLSPRNLL